MERSGGEHVDPRPFVLRAKGFRRLSVIGSHPLFLFTIVVPFGATVGLAADLGGWFVIVLLCQAATLATSMLVGASRSEVRFAHGELVDRRIIGSKRWSWDEVGCLAIGHLGRGSVHVVVCVLGDPWPHRLRGFPMPSAYRAPFSEIVDLIRSHGYSIESPEKDAHEWWAADPRARPARRDGERT